MAHTTTGRAARERRRESAAKRAARPQKSYKCGHTHSKPGAQNCPVLQEMA